MKQNITLAVDKQLLRRARALAAQRGTSISALLASDLREIVEREAAYEQAKAKALARLQSPFRLGGAKVGDREAWHERKGLR